MVVRIIFYLLGLLIMTLGIGLSVKSNLGVSPVSSIPYTGTVVWGIEMGKATIVFHVALVLIQIALLRKNFNKKNLLQIPVGVLFGYFTTFSNSLMALFPDPSNFGMQLALNLASTAFVAFGIFLYVPADIMPLAGEGVMLAVSQVTKVKFSTCKLSFDITMVSISLVVCLAMVGSLGSVGLGTIVAAVLVGLELKFFIKKLGALRSRILPKTGAAAVVAESPLLKIMKTEIYTIPEDNNLLDALSLFMKKKISGAPIVNAEGKITGFITDGDVMRYLAGEQPLFVHANDLKKISFNDKLRELVQRKVKEVAGKDVITVEACDDLASVCAVMAEHHLKKAPVMSNGRMIGMINASNITKYAVRLMMGEV